MFSILMTSLTDTPLMLQWEVWLRSLLGLKGLTCVALTSPNLRFLASPSRCFSYYSRLKRSKQRDAARIPMPLCISVYVGSKRPTLARVRPIMLWNAKLMWRLIIPCDVTGKSESLVSFFAQRSWVFKKATGEQTEWFATFWKKTKQNKKKKGKENSILNKLTSRWIHQGIQTVRWVCTLRARTQLLQCHQHQESVTWMDC